MCGTTCSPVVAKIVPKNLALKQVDNIHSIIYFKVQNDGRFPLKNCLIKRKLYTLLISQTTLINRYKKRPIVRLKAINVLRQFSSNFQNNHTCTSLTVKLGLARKQ